MKVAFCFLTYGDLSQPAIWRSFFRNASSPFSVLIHNKEPLKDAYFSKYCIPDRINTRYGHISLVKATLKLFKEAYLDEENIYFILLSDTCIPLYDLNTIHHKVVAVGSSVIHKVESVGNRFKFLHDKEYFNREDFSKQSQWMILHRKDLDFLARNDITDSVYGARVFGADEHYFINLFDKFGVAYLNKSITSVDWSEPVVTKQPYHYSPKIYHSLERHQIAQARNDGNLFMRKISGDCRVPQFLIDDIRSDSQ